jgi:hypothetical protein
MIPRGESLPADHPLAGCVEKAWRGFDHYDALRRSITELRDAGEYARFEDLLSKDPERPGIWTCRTVVAEVLEPPLKLATMIGDVVHNLRSSLDHLVFELAFLGQRGKKVPGRVAFPVSLTRSNWNSKYVQDTLLAGVLQKHRRMIYRLQPCYRRQDKPGPRALTKRRRKPLADLEALWKDDKHRVLEPVFLAPYEIIPKLSQFTNCRPTGDTILNPDFLGRPLAAGAEVLRVEVQEAGGEVIGLRVNAQVAAEVGFRNGIPVLRALAAMGDPIPPILEWFRPEFETPFAKKLWGVSRGSWIEKEPRRSPRMMFARWTWESARPEDNPDDKTTS